MSGRSSLRRVLSGVAPSPSTRVLVEQIRADLDSADASAMPAPRAWEHGAAERVALPTAVDAHVSKPLFGRAGELEILIKRWRNVVADRRLRCAVLAGEPGVGKTRLVAELCRMVQSEGAAVLYRLRCSVYTASDDAT